jgi:hypothetical protein
MPFQSVDGRVDPSQRPSDACRPPNKRVPGTGGGKQDKGSVARRCPFSPTRDRALEAARCGTAHPRPPSITREPSTHGTSGVLDAISPLVGDDGFARPPPARASRTTNGLNTQHHRQLRHRRHRPPLRSERFHYLHRPISAPDPPRESQSRRYGREGELAPPSSTTSRWAGMPLD